MNPYAVRQSTMGELGSEDPGIEAMRMAIVARACNDYLMALRGKKHNSHASIGAQEELEAFFLSPWFGKLCPVNGRALILALRKRHKQGGKFIYYGPYAEKEQ